MTFAPEASWSARIETPPVPWTRTVSPPLRPAFVRVLYPARAAHLCRRESGERSRMVGAHTAGRCSRQSRSLLIAKMLRDAGESLQEGDLVSADDGTD